MNNSFSVGFLLARFGIDKSHQQIHHHEVTRHKDTVPTKLNKKCINKEYKNHPTMTVKHCKVNVSNTS